MTHPESAPEARPGSAGARPSEGGRGAISGPPGRTTDGLAPLRDWLRAWQACVRAVDFAAGRTLCAEDIVAFGTVAPFVTGLDAVEREQWRHVWPVIRDFTVDVDGARGVVAGDRAWIAAVWDSRGRRPDGTWFPRPGRCTIAFERRGGRWLATHTHFSLVPAPAGTSPTPTR